MSLNPRGHIPGVGEQQQQSARPSWSAASPPRGVTTIASGRGEAAANNATHTNSSAFFNGAALLLDAAARAGSGEVSTPTNHGGFVAPMPTRIIASEGQKAMTHDHHDEASTTTTTTMMKQVLQQAPNAENKAKMPDKKNASSTTAKYGTSSNMVIMASGSSALDGNGADTLGQDSNNSSNKSSRDDGNGRLYATVHPAFWGMESKATTKILVKIRMKNAAENPLAPANANGNPQLYATLPPGFWKMDAKMASTCTKVRVKIPTKKLLLAPTKKKATDAKPTSKTKKKDKDLPSGVRRKDDKYLVSVCLPGIGGSRTIGTFATKEMAIEAMGYADAKVQGIRLELGGQKLETKSEKDAKLNEVKAHVTQSIANKILVGPTPSPSATLINSTAAKQDVVGANPHTCISDIPRDYRPPTNYSATTLGTSPLIKKRTNQVLHDMSAEEASERANHQGPPNADHHRRRNKSNVDEKSLPLKKRRLIIFEESPKQGQDDVQEQANGHHHQQKQDVQNQASVKEHAKAHTRPSPQLSTASSRFGGTSSSQSFTTDQAMKLRSTLDELINKGVIEWRPSGLSFIIKKTDFLRASDFATLSAFGFGQIMGGDDLGAIIHPNYRRDQPALPLLPTRRSAKTNYCLSIAQDRYGSGTFLDVVIPRRNVSNPSSSFGIDLTYDTDGWTRVHTRTGQHGWLRDGDIVHAVNGENMFLPNSLMFSPSHQQKPMLHAIVVMACRRTPSGMPLTLRLFRENKSALSTSI